MVDITPSRKGRKPQGEFVWVIYGKTQYMAQLVEPLEQVSSNDPKDPLTDDPKDPSTDDQKTPSNDDNKNDDVDDDEEEEDEVEVQWTHNGVFEWVPLASVKVHETATVGRRESLRKSPITKRPLDLNSENPMPLPPRSSKKRTATEAAVDEEQTPATDDAKNESKDTSEDKAVDGTNLPDASTEEPPTKKQKTGKVLPSLFSTLTTKVGTVKKSFVAGCQEIYKELLGPSS